MNDKIKHFIVGFLVAQLFTPLTFYSSIGWSLLITFILATLVFIGKEIFDIYKPIPTGFDWYDIYADYLGFALGLFISSIIFIFLQ